jgi:hypothetical protein
MPGVQRAMKRASSASVVVFSFGAVVVAGCGVKTVY